MWANPLCFSAAVSCHLIPLTSPPRSDSFVSSSHRGFSSKIVSLHPVVLPLGVSSSHIMSPHGTSSRLMVSIFFSMVHSRSALRSCFQLTHLLSHLLNGTVEIFSYVLLVLLAARLISPHLLLCLYCQPAPRWH